MCILALLLIAALAWTAIGVTLARAAAAELAKTVYLPPRATDEDLQLFSASYLAELRAREAALADEFIPNQDIPLPAELQRFTVELCEEKDIDPVILYRLMWRESRYKTDAWRMDTNGYESVGLCQINGMTYPFLAERGIDPRESPEANITAAVELITYYRDEREYSMLEALSAYGSGEGGMWSERSLTAARRLMGDKTP